MVQYNILANRKKFLNESIIIAVSKCITDLLFYRNLVLPNISKLSDMVKNTIRKFFFYIRLLVKKQIIHSFQRKAPPQKLQFPNQPLSPKPRPPPSTGDSPCARAPDPHQLSLTASYKNWSRTVVCSAPVAPVSRFFQPWASASRSPLATRPSQRSLGSVLLGVWLYAV